MKNVSLALIAVVASAALAGCQHLRSAFGDSSTASSTAPAPSASTSTAISPSSSTSSTGMGQSGTAH